MTTGVNGPITTVKAWRRADLSRDPEKAPME